jgi:hypothetical protein
VLETEKRRKNELQVTWLCTAEVQLSLAHRTVSGAPGWTLVKRLLSGNILRSTAIIHRTVRWCTGLSGEPTVASATVGHAISGRRVARANGRQGAPDCPVCTGQCTNCPGAATVICAKKDGDRHRTVYSDCPVAHRTIRCATRQKARMAFLACLQRLLAALGL